MEPEEEPAVHSLGHWGVEDDEMDVGMEFDDPINDVHVLSVLRPACVKGRVNGKYTKLIMDSGASISVIKTEYLQEVLPQWRARATAYRGKRILTAAGHYLTTRGCISLPVHLGKRVFTLTFVITDELPHPVLIGTDTMLPLNIDLLFSRRVVMIDGVDCCPLSVKQPFFKQGGATVNACTIPAEHAAVVWVTVPDNLEHEMWMAEGIDKLLQVARTLLRPDKVRQVPVQIMNLSLTDIEIPANKLIVKLSPVTDTTNPIPTEEAEEQDVKITAEIDEAVKKTKLSEAHKAKLKEFLTKRKRVFREPASLGQANVPPVSIRTTTDRPIAQLL